MKIVTGRKREREREREREEREQERDTKRGIMTERGKERER